MKSILLLLVVCASSVFASEPGPAVLECPVGTVCRTWVENGQTFLEVVNEADRAVAGTVTLNEIYEKAINVTNRFVAEIDGRWIEVVLPARGRMTLRLGK